MKQRYERAVRLTAPRFVASTPGIGVDGYWLDPERYFFLAERVGPLGAVVGAASIANARTGAVEEVMPVATLADLLSQHSNQNVEDRALAGASIDMPDPSTLAVSLGGQDFLIDHVGKRVVEARPSLDVPALYSPDGRWACFVKGYDLWLEDRRTGAESPLTQDGARHWCYGQPSETALSAVTYRRKPSPVGMWSPDAQWFLTHRIDERSLPELALVQNVPPGGGRPLLHTFKSSLPCDPLPIATYVAIHVPSGRVISFPDSATPVAVFSPFAARVAWFAGADTAWHIRLDRYCKRAELVQLDLVKGTSRVVLSEDASSGYLDLHPLLMGTPNVRTLPASEEVIWFSERDGWGHLYLHDARTGALKNRITQGEWLVRDIVHVDERERRVLFLAGGLEPNDNPLRRALCAVNLDGSDFRVLLAHDGDISVPRTEPCGLHQDRPFRPSYAPSGVAPGGRFAVVQYGNVGTGNRTDLIDLRGERVLSIASARPPADDVRVREFTALSADGGTRLHGVMFLPSDFDDARRYPLVDYIYPGPQVAQQPQSFRAVHSAQALSLAELGFVAVMFDTRGTPLRSRAFHQAGYGQLLEPQLADHAAVVRQLCERHSFIDADRIGMLGISGGGAATARALCDYGDLFKAGVAVCGNHDSTLYAAIWSDKYRGPEGRERWPAQANRSVAHKLAGKLLLISGDMDENVHVSHTLSLADALVRANKDFDLLIVPNEGHPVLWANGYAQRRAWDYLVTHLLGEVPPPEFEVRFEQHEIAGFLKRWMREARQ